ncbi:MAG: undecaprenyldiphospho-muramoylpentapeptide beta-N-acetylglucosaminyltransferase [Myxococcota bacterium]
MIQNILVAGGGTGGHLFPGIAVIEEIRRRNPALRVLFVGTRRGIESTVVPGLGYPIEFIDVAPLKGRTPTQLLSSLSVLPTAAVRSGSILRRFSPDVVVGVGGYASGPVLAAAAALGVPTAVLEQNAQTGFTNKLLGPFVGRAYVTFSETKSAFRPSNVRVVGNPVRRKFVDVARRGLSDPDGFEARCRGILVVGGSQGAKVLNETVPQAIVQLLKSLRAKGESASIDTSIPIVHQTGAAMCEEVARTYSSLGLRAKVVPFIEDMAGAYAQSSVVVCRAGASTVAELCAVGRPSVMIPFPFAADDHQMKNALALERAGASRCLAQGELTPAKLAEVLRPIVFDSSVQKRMAESARELGRPDAAATIVDDLHAWLFGLGGEQDEVQEALSECLSDEDGANESRRERVMHCFTSAVPGPSLRGQRPYVPGRRSPDVSFAPRSLVTRRPLVFLS